MKKLKFFTAVLWLVLIPFLLNSVSLDPELQNTDLLPYKSLEQNCLDSTLQMKVMGIREAGAPLVFGKDIIFSYEPEKHASFVGAKFEHENYKVLHPYKKNQHHIFILILPIPEEIQTVKYRMVVDGLWIRDPFNPHFITDNFGFKHSFFELPIKKEKIIKNPIFENDNIISFMMKTSPGREIYIVGDFNHWDPFIHRLKEINPGIYKISLRMYPGRHYYYFLVDGAKILDPYNIEIMINSQGFEVSTFVLK